MDFKTREDRVAGAGEYVLGTLSPEEKAEFNQALSGNAELRAELHWWERRLAALGLRLPAREPRPMVWLDIQHRIRSTATALPTARPGRAMTTWAWLATAASMVLAVGLVLETQKAPQVITQSVPVAAKSYVALLQVPQSTMNWTVSVTPDRKEIVVRASGDVPAAAKNLDAELWVIADGKPISMGVIPKTGESRYAMKAGLSLVAGQTLAVSLEPIGGSPTGQPTGPVVTTAAVLLAG